MRREVPFLLGLAVLLACVHARVLPAPPVHDDALLGEAAAPPGGLPARFLHPNVARQGGAEGLNYAYRPLTELTFALTGPSPAGHRLGNLALHLVSTALVLWIAGLAGMPSGTARVAALLFALHPMAVQAVGYAYQRCTGLEACLAFLCLGLYASRRRGAALAVAVLAAMSKETAVTVPLMLGAWEIVLRDPREGAAAAWRRWAPFTLPPVLVLVQVLRAQASGPSLDFLGGPGVPGPLDYLLGELPVVMGYLRLSALPFPLRFWYEPASGPSWRTAAAALLLGLLVLWILRGAPGARLPRLGAALFLAPLALESTVFPIRDPGFHHRCYPALLGGGMLLACMLERAASRSLAAAVLALFALGAGAEGLRRRDPSELFRRDLRHAPRAPQAWLSQTILRAAQADLERAARLSARSAPLRWQPFRMWTLRAELLLACGKTGEARSLAEALRQDHPGAPLSPALAALLPAVEAGRPSESARLEAAAEADRAAGLFQQGDFSGSERALRKALALDPGLAQAHSNLGAIHARRGQLAEAEASFRRAVELAPDYAVGWGNLAQILRLRGRLEEARKAEAEARARGAR